MNEQKAPLKKTDSTTTKTTEPIGTPTTEPTNPHNQEPVGDWMANERAAERKNNEPGLTDAERQQRKL